MELKSLKRPGAERANCLRRDAAAPKFLAQPITKLSRVPMHIVPKTQADHTRRGTRDSMQKDVGGCSFIACSKYRSASSIEYGCGNKSRNPRHTFRLLACNATVGASSPRHDLIVHFSRTSSTPANYQNLAVAL
jgi:hypothetical protein